MADGGDPTENAAALADVTVISVSYNSAGVIGDMLESRPKGLGAIVVDNASADDSVQVACAHGARVIVLKHNVGFGTGASVGGFAAETKYLLFANPDVAFQPGVVSQLHAALEADAKLAAVGPTLYDGGETRPQKLFNFISQKIGPAPTERPANLSGSCFMMRTELFKKFNGFDPRIFLFYEEDDLFHRLRSAGHELDLIKEAGVQHVVGASSGQGVRYRAAWLRWFHDIESKLYVCGKYGLPMKPWKDLRRGFVRAFLGAVSFNRKQVVEGAGRFWAAALWLAGSREPAEQKPEVIADHPAGSLELASSR